MSFQTAGSCSAPARIGLTDRDQRHEIPFHARRLLPGAVDRLGGGEVHRRAGAEPFGGDRGAPARGEGDRPAGGSRSASGGAGQGSGPTEPFPTQAEGGALAEPAGVDRAAAHAGGVRPDAAAARQPVHDRRAGGVADRRRRRAGRRRLHPDLGRDRGAGRGMRHHGPERAADGRARGARHHRGASARQASEPRQCGAGGFAGMEDVDRARPQTKGAKTPRRGRGGRVQKNRGHG